jgi:hypothetical protein
MQISSVGGKLLYDIHPRCASCQTGLVGCELLHFQKDNDLSAFFSCLPTSTLFKLSIALPIVKDNQPKNMLKDAIYNFLRI